MEPTLSSETSAFKLQTPGKFPKEHRQAYNCMCISWIIKDLFLTERLFGLLRQHLGGRRLQSNEKVEMAVRERLRINKPDLYGSKMLQQVPQREKCIDIFWACVEEQR